MKCNVLQFLDSFEQGGSERQAVQLSRLLSESGSFHVRVASLSPHGLLRKEVEQLNTGKIESFPLKSFYHKDTVNQLWRFIRFLRSSEIKILHTHDFYTNIFGMVAGKLAKVPVRIASLRETQGMRTDAQKRVLRAAYHLAHHIVANSEAVHNQLICEGISKDKIRIVYNGVDLDRITPKLPLTRAEALSLLGLPLEVSGRRRNHVVIVANMRHAVKNHSLFLRSAQHVVEHHSNTLFLLAGEGELMDSLRALAAQLGIESKVFFLNRCEHIAELLSISDVCVLSSNAEGFSNSIIEYMAASRPVVATDVGGASEAIIDGETGFLVPSDDEKTMAKRIIWLLAHPELASEMGKKGRRRVEKRFSCDAQLKQIEDLYSELLTAKKDLVQQRDCKRKSESCSR